MPFRSLTLPARLLPAAALVALVVCLGEPGASATGAPQTKDAPKVDPEHAAKMAKGTELFKNSVRGVLQAKCVKCHGGEQTKSGLDLRTATAIRLGGDTGPSIVPGDAAKSLLSKS